MIEGLIIIGIIAFAVVIALFGTTILSGITATITSLTAMVTGIISGGATLLTSWIYWATANFTFTNYVGIAWLATWGVLFAYAGYEIAFSKNDRGWRNAVGRRSNYVGVLLLLFLLLQPIAISYGASFLADQTAYVEVDYNATVVDAGSDGYHTDYWYLKNATTSYLETQTTIIDNTTKSISMVSLAHDDLATIGTPTQCSLRFRLNTTFLASHRISKFVLSWNYVGAGNLTSYRIVKGSPVLGYLTDTTPITSDNGTAIIIPETFQSIQYQSNVRTEIFFNFEDMDNIAQAGDYMEMSLKFYEISTIMSQETILFWLAVSITVINVAILMVTSKAYKYIM